MQEPGRPVLRTVTRTQGANEALKSGEVTPRGFRLEFEDVPVLVSAFRRMVRELAYDVSEMALTTYLVAKEHGVEFTALPIFIARGLHHGVIQVAAAGGIRHPKDLEGRRVGVDRGYTVTTGVWARAILQEEYGVDLDRELEDGAGEFCLPQKSADQPVDAHQAVVRHEQAAVRRRGDARLESPNCVAVQPLRIDAGRVEPDLRPQQPCGVVVVERDLERAGARILDRGSPRF